MLTGERQVSASIKNYTECSVSSSVLWPISTSATQPTGEGAGFCRDYNNPLSRPLVGLHRIRPTNY